MDGSPPPGPPNGLVAPTLLPVVVTMGPLSVMALAKSSLAGACANAETAAKTARKTTQARRRKARIKLLSQLRLPTEDNRKWPDVTAQCPERQSCSNVLSDL